MWLWYASSSSVNPASCMMSIVDSTRYDRLQPDAEVGPKGSHSPPVPPAAMTDPPSRIGCGAGEGR